MRWPGQLAAGSRQSAMLLAVLAGCAPLAASPAPRVTEADRQAAARIPVAANFAARRWGVPAPLTPRTRGEPERLAPRTRGEPAKGRSSGQPLPALNDGRLATSAQVAVGQPVTIRLAALLLVSSSRLHFPRSARGPLGYRIEVSEDGRKWQRVLQQDGLKAERLQVDTFRPAFARAVRVTFTRAGGARTVPVAEVELYGTCGEPGSYGAR